MQAQRRKLVEDYWFRQFAGGLEKVRLPVFEREGEEARPGAGEAWLELPEATAAALRKISRGSPLGIFILLASGLGALLRRYTGLPEFLVGTRLPAEAGAQRPWSFIRNRIELGARLDRVIEQTRQTVQEAYRFDDYEPEGLLAALRRRTGRDPWEMVTVGCVYDELHGEGSAELGGFELLVSLRTAGEHLQVRATYLRALYEASTVERFLGSLARVLGELSQNLGRAVGDIEILSEDERRTLLGFNPPPTSFPAEKTVDQLFDEQVARSPEAIALLQEDVRLTYQEVKRRADALAHALRSRGVERGTRVALLMDPSPEAVIGMMGIIKAGGCFVPIGRGMPGARQKLLVADAACSLLLTTTREREGADRLLGGEAILCIDELQASAESAREAWRVHGANDLIYIMYTSGTTGRPKGVMVEHVNVVRLVRGSHFIPLERPGRILQTGALEFDASTFEIWGALLNGWTLCLGSRQTILDAEKLRGLIGQYGVTTMWLTAPLFSHFVRGDAGVFRGLEHLVVGGSVVYPADVNRLRRECPGLTIINGYGPTENTTFSTTFTIDHDCGKRVPIGRPIANSSAFIVNEHERLQPIGVPGQLYVGGAGVARGYLNDPAATALHFAPFGEAGRIYKTGDFARWLPDGNLDFLGRQDDQVKLRGYRVEPGEIEAYLRAQQGIRDAVVLPVTEEGGETALCAYVVSDAVDTERLREALASTFPDYMVPAYLVMLDRLPLSSTGKLDRAALPQPTRWQYGGGQAPRNETERRMSELWREVLGVDNIGREDDFFALGGHSMLGLRLLGAIEREFSAKLGLQHLFQYPTVEKLALAVDSAEKSSREPVLPQVESGGVYELSVSQRRLAEFYEKAPDNPAFNISEATTWSEAVDLQTVRRALQVLVDRHEGLRMAFHKGDGRFVQTVAPRGKVNLRFHDLSTLDAAELPARRQRLIESEGTAPFRIEEGSLYRVTIIKAGEAEHDVVWTVHHIIADGWSLDVLQTEFDLLYHSLRKGAPARLEPVRAQFKDFVVWHNRILADEARSRPAVEFWRRTLADPVKVRLPYDHERSGITVGMPSSGYRACIGAEPVRRLWSLAKENRTSLFMVLFAAFHKLLHELSGQTDLITGIPSANRQRDEFKGTVGFFVDSVIIRASVEPGEPFEELLRRVSLRTLESLDNAYYPIEMACRVVGLTWPEILSVFFNMSTFGSTRLKPLTDTRWSHLPSVQNSKLPLVFYLTEWKDGVEMNVHYYNELFEPATVEKLVRRYVEIAEGAADEGPRSVKR
jgi:amino acid adenylation domain-containing protein